MPAYGISLGTRSKALAEDYSQKTDVLGQMAESVSQNFRRRPCGLGLM